jgi:hypothetical protein
MTTKMTAFKHSCKDLHPQNPLIIPSGKQSKTLNNIKKPSPLLQTSQGIWARSNVKKAHAFAKHLAEGFQPHPSENEPNKTQ